MRHRIRVIQRGVAGRPRSGASRADDVPSRAQTPRPPPAAAPPRPPRREVRPAAKPYKAPRTPDGQPDLQGFWTNSTYTPLERPNGVTKEFYTPEEARGRDRSRRGRTRSGADRARHDGRRALRLHAVRPGPEPVEVRAEPAHVADHRSAGRQDSAGHAGGPEARRRARGRAEDRGRPVRRRRRTCRSARAASSWAAPVPR